MQPSLILSIILGLSALIMPSSAFSVDSTVPRFWEFYRSRSQRIPGLQWKFATSALGGKQAKYPKVIVSMLYPGKLRCGVLGFPNQVDLEGQSRIAIPLARRINTLYCSALKGGQVIATEQLKVINHRINQSEQDKGWVFSPPPSSSKEQHVDFFASSDQRIQGLQWHTGPLEFSMDDHPKFPGFVRVHGFYKGDIQNLACRIKGIPHPIKFKSNRITLKIRIAWPEMELRCTDESQSQDLIVHYHYWQPKTRPRPPDDTQIWETGIAFSRQRIKEEPLIDRSVTTLEAFMGIDVSEPFGWSGDGSLGIVADLAILEASIPGPSFRKLNMFSNYTIHLLDDQTDLEWNLRLGLRSSHIIVPNSEYGFGNRLLLDIGQEFIFPGSRGDWLMALHWQPVSLLDQKQAGKGVDRFGVLGKFTIFGSERDWILGVRMDRAKYYVEREGRFVSTSHWSTGLFMGVRY